MSPVADAVLPSLAERRRLTVASGAATSPASLKTLAAGVLARRVALTRDDREYFRRLLRLRS